MRDFINDYLPDNAAVILSDKCTASCKECCFSCTPFKNNTLTNDEVFSFIDGISSFKTLKYIVWTGGEAFLLGNRLAECLEYAKNKGLYSRIVTNGYWATNHSQANKKLEVLKQAGLCELNLSTGDNHQEFVSIDRVMTAALESLRLGINTVISIETTKYSKFKENDIYLHPLYESIQVEKLDEKLTLLNATWVSFHKDEKYSYDSIEQKEVEYGCNNLYNFIGLNLKNEIVFCCGLTLEYIPEMKLGKDSGDKIKEAYDKQKNDFIKRWLFVSGPINILKQAIEWDDSIVAPKFAHHCQTCAYIFQNDKVRQSIINNYKTIEGDINSKFANKMKLNTILK